MYITVKLAAMALIMTLSSHIAFACPELGSGSQAEAQVRDFVSSLDYLNDQNEVNKAVETCFYRFEIKISEESFSLMLSQLRLTELDLLRDRISLYGQRMRAVNHRRRKQGRRPKYSRRNIREAKREMWLVGLKRLDLDVTADSKYSQDETMKRMIKSYLNSKSGDVSAEAMKAFALTTSSFNMDKLVYHQFSLLLENGEMNAAVMKDLIGLLSTWSYNSEMTENAKKTAEKMAKAYIESL